MNLYSLGLLMCCLLAFIPQQQALLLLKRRDSRRFSFIAPDSGIQKSVIADFVVIDQVVAPGVFTHVYIGRQTFIRQFNIDTQPTGSGNHWYLSELNIKPHTRGSDLFCRISLLFNGDVWSNEIDVQEFSGAKEACGSLQLLRVTGLNSDPELRVFDVRYDTLLRERRPYRLPSLSIGEHLSLNPVMIKKQACVVVLPLDETNILTQGLQVSLTRFYHWIKVTSMKGLNNRRAAPRLAT